MAAQAQGQSLSRAHDVASYSSAAWLGRTQLPVRHVGLYGEQLRALVQAALAQIVADVNVQPAPARSGLVTERRSTKAYCAKELGAYICPESKASAPGVWCSDAIVPRDPLVRTLQLTLHPIATI
jgi:hypothetical protein